MGLFSRREKPPKVSAAPINNSDLSIDSAVSSLKSPSGTLRNTTVTTSGGPGSVPVSLSKMDLPRAPDPQLDPAGYLRSLGAVRERSKIILDKALRNELNHFDVDLRKFPDVVSFVSGIIKVHIYLIYTTTTLSMLRLCPLFVPLLSFSL